MPLDKQPCLHCDIRDACLNYAKKHRETSMQDILHGLTHVMGEFLAELDIEDRECFLFQILSGLPRAIVTNLPEDDDEEEGDGDNKDDGVRH